MGDLRVRELTPRGRGGVSVVELAGSGALERAAALGGVGPLRPGRPRLARLRGADGALLDEALLVPISERVVELHLHGSPPAVSALIADLISGGARPSGAATGLEARARELLARAPSEPAARILLDQAEGALARELRRLALTAPRRWRAGLEELSARGRAARPALEPPRVVLAGPANAGKSSLFNLLVGRERVVVSGAGGTTRDAIVERVHLGAYAVDLVDTAGEREPGLAELQSDAAAELDRQGQVLGRRARSRAELVLWLDPRGLGPPRRGSVPLAVLASRADEREPMGGATPDARLSVHRDPGGARRAVERVFHTWLELARDPWTPGLGLPFDSASRADIEELLVARGAEDSICARRLGVLRCLGRADGSVDVPRATIDPRERGR